MLAFQRWYVNREHIFFCAITYITRWCDGSVTFAHASQHMMLRPPWNRSHGSLNFPLDRNGPQYTALMSHHAHATTSPQSNNQNWLWSLCHLYIYMDIGIPRERARIALIYTKSMRLLLDMKNRTQKKFFFSSFFFFLPELYFDLYRYYPFEC